MVADENWLEKNDTRAYPLVDGVDARGGLLPTNAIVDLHVSVTTSKDDVVYVSSLSIGHRAVQLTISTVELGEILTVSAPWPEAYRGYALAPARAGLVAHGRVCFGSIVTRDGQSFSATDLLPNDAQILPTLVTRLPTLPFSNFRVGPNTADGVIVVEGADGFVPEIREIALPGPGDTTTNKTALVIGLQDDIDVLERPLQECQRPLESGHIPQGDFHPVLSINGVYPNADGTIFLHLLSDRFSYVDEYGMTHEDPLLEAVAGEGAVITFKSNIDLSDLCGGSSRKGVVYAPSSCVSCGAPSIDDADKVALSRIFVHRQYLVVEFVYGGAGVLIAGDVQPEFPDGDLAIVTRVSATGGYGPGLAYDVDTACNPIPLQRPSDTPCRIVYALNKIVRNQECAIRVLARSGVAVEQPPNNRPAAYQATRSPSFDICGIPVKDAFVFDGTFMNETDQAAIEDELLLYSQGQPLPEAP